MARLIPNAFSSWELTENEEHQGSMFTITQLQVLQNTLSNIANEKIMLIFDTSKPEAFIQDNAYKDGQIEILTWLIDTSVTLSELPSNPED